jgi:predicted SprT family Zn-dependent metalloprotease
MTAKELEKQFLKLLQRAGQRGKRLELVYTSRADGLTAYAGLFHDDRSVRLYYTDELLSAESDELQAMLKHEVCHVITRPRSRVPRLCPEDTAEFKAWNQFYSLSSEYEAHQEFQKRFDLDIPGLRTLNQKLFELGRKWIDRALRNYLTLLGGSTIEDDEILFPLFVELFQFFEILLTADMTNDTRYMKLIEQEALVKLYEYYRWIKDLLETVSKKKDYREKVDELWRLFPIVHQLRVPQRQEF